MPSSPSHSMHLISLFAGNVTLSPKRSTLARPIKLASTCPCQICKGHLKYFFRSLKKQSTHPIGTFATPCNLQASSSACRLPLLVIRLCTSISISATYNECCLSVVQLELLWWGSAYFCLRSDFVQILALNEILRKAASSLSSFWTWVRKTPILISPDYFNKKSPFWFLRILLTFPLSDQC